MSELPNRVAIVTGAAQGLGLAIALHLADDGLDVAVNDIPAKSEQLQGVVSEIQARGRRSIAVMADISVEDEVKSMVEHVASQLGGIDVMVANAGIAILKPLLETSTEEWDRLMSINLRGVMFCYRHAAEQMIKQGASSAAGKKACTNLAAYTVSKFAVRGLTQALSLELRQHNITVNAYAPGIIMTPLADHPDDTVNGGKGSTIKKLFGLPPTHPHGDSVAIASLVSHLAKPESYFITGEHEHHL
ncbi:hypothetical protein CERSUDRAFT_97294 [Gelatoporia subvermispora B]|uniref:NAD-binding protein n=1 Tax=Ceriporiopsis subvermispora (strain B) TaxID=914234 RepID=M2R8D4_CERS8|nr:hypothetical protein CERSUDRAFT_97294 [Gelatoporia subvermispora B]